MSIGALLLFNIVFMIVVGLFAGISHQKFIETNNLNKLSKVSKSPSDICNTDVCQTAGKLIRDSMNSSVDPCDDFYAFACGGWMATHTIPPEKSRYDSFDVLDEELQKSLKEELSEPSKVDDADSVIYASDLFKACIDNGMYFQEIKVLAFILNQKKFQSLQNEIIINAVHVFKSKNAVFSI
jgi:predicted metalloendopeptidase